jgi:aspartate aminotransferase-like enzyme
VVSSAYAYSIDFEAAQLDLAVTSSAKAIQAAPGLGVVFVKHAAVGQLGRGASYYLDLVGEYHKQRKERQPRFAQPVALHAGLRAACIHMREVGIENHFARIQRQMDRVASFLAGLGVEPMLERGKSSWIAVNFRLPPGVAYGDFARRIEAEGYYLLYGIPGDSTHFQVSTIGDLSDDNVSGLTDALGHVLGPRSA